MESFSAWITSLGVSFERVGQRTWYFPSKNLRIHYAEDEHSDQGIRIWPQQWAQQQSIIKSRIASRLGLLPSLPARVCVVKRISQPSADEFLRVHHLQGSTTSKIKLGLFLPAAYYRLLPYIPAEEEFLLGVMTFSGGRSFRDGSRSCELIRFAMHGDFHVKGGFSKLLRFFEREKDPDSIMTYVDKEWHRIGVYSSLGFEEKEHLPPLRSTVGEEGVWQGFTFVNKGSIKMLWTKK